MTEMSTSNGYINYQKMLSQMSEGMAGLSEVCGALTLDDHMRALNNNRERMQNRIFSVGIMGEFRRGKSTVINALLGKDIVPSDIVPTSATLNYIRWDAASRAEIHFKDGQTQQVPVDDLAKYVTKITAEYERTAESVDNAVVYYPCPFCQNGVEIVDTPGLNDDEHMTRISEEVIPKLDAIIMVLVPDSPFSISEADFVRSKVMSSDLGRIIFVLNKIDQVSERNRPRLIASIKEKITKTVLEKQDSMYGVDSVEYEDAKQKLAGIRLYPLSAYDALEGKLQGDADMVAKSGILEFEAVLEKMLTEERGMLELVSPVNSVLSIAAEAKATIGMRRDALELQFSEFEVIQKESMEKLQAQRELKRKEVNALKGRATNLYSELLPEVTAAYDNIEAEVLAFVDKVAITQDDVKNERIAEQTGKNISAAIDICMKRCLAESTEKLTVAIQNRIGDEMVDLQEFVHAFSAEMDGIQNSISPNMTKKKADWVAIGADVASTYMLGGFGMGGVIAGWKANGLPGALVGGGVGALASLSAMTALVMLGMPIALPLFVVGGIASMFGGKAAVNLAFKKKLQQKKISELRSALSQNVQTAISDMRKSHALEGWMKDTSASAYAALADMLDREVEAQLHGLESTLTQTKLDLQKNRQERDKLLADMAVLEKKLDTVRETITPVKKRLAQALEME